jgi:hypothetical protein
MCQICISQLGMSSLRVTNFQMILLVISTIFDLNLLVYLALQSATSIFVTCSHQFTVRLKNSADMYVYIYI